MCSGGHRALNRKRGRHRGHVGFAHGKAVHRRIVERRVVDQRVEVGGKDAAMSGAERDLTGAGKGSTLRASAAMRRASSTSRSTARPCPKGGPDALEDGGEASVIMMAGAVQARRGAPWHPLWRPPCSRAVLPPCSLH